MSDFDLDKSFADDLGKERPFEPADDGWKNLSAALDRQTVQAQRFRNYRLVATSAAAAVALMLVVGVFAWNHLDQRSAQLEQKIAQLEQQINTVQQPGATAPNAAPEMQELPQKSFNTLPDNTFNQAPGAHSGQDMQQTTANNAGQTKNPQQQQFLPKNTTSGVALPTKAAQRSTNSVNNNTAGQPSETGNTTQETAATEPNASGEAQPETTGQATNAVQNFTPVPVDVNAVASTGNNPDAVGKLLVPVTPPPVIRPVKTSQRRLGIGPVIGLEMLNDDDGGFIFEEGLGKGVGAQFALNNNISLTGELLHSKPVVSYRHNNSNGGPGQQHTHLPQPPSSPNPGDKLETTELQQTEFEIGLGIRYAFLPGKKLRPFAGVHWIASIFGEPEYRYHFHNQQTQTETILRHTESSEGFTGGRFRLAAGAQWNFAPRFAWNIEVNYQGSVAPRQPNRSSHETAGLFTGIYYFL